MRKTIPLFLLLTFALWGCGQRGRFIAMGHSYRGLEGRIGGMDIVDGCPTLGEGGGNLLYTLIVGPVIQAHGQSIESDDGRYVTTTKHSWTCDSNTLGIAILWDREMDTVSFGKQTFSRAKGNAFIARMATNGTIPVQQLTGLNSVPGHRQALKYIQGLLTNDQTIGSLKLEK